MLDIKFIRENADLVKDAARKKHIDCDLDALLASDAERVRLIADVDQLRATQNAANTQVVNATDPVTKENLFRDLKATKQKLAAAEEKLKTVLVDWQKLMLQVPNVPDMSVPEGVSDAENVEIRSWGEKPNFSFTPRSHVELLKALNLIDLERGTKVAGFRGYVLRGAAVELMFAIFQLALKHFGSRGFVPHLVPSLVRRDGLVGTGYLPQGEDDLYHTQDGDYLSGTAEVASMALWQNETIDLAGGPLKMLSFSDCFRRESGSHGKDTYGLIRVHEFYKWEQLVLCEANHETSVALHEELTKNAEDFLQLLGLPYRVVLNCGGDIGLGQVKKYDLEAWVPSEHAYRETHSASYFHDFQTRRLGIRYRDASGTLRFAHSLNNTAAALPRLLVPLIENNQQEDGRIAVPPALQPYLGTDALS